MPATRGPTVTLQTRDLSDGMHRAAARTALSEREADWLENWVPIGPGNLRSVPGPGAAVATLTGIETLWGVTLALGRRLITVHTDGSLRAIDPGTGTVTVIAAAGAWSADTRVDTWRTDLVLFGSRTRGYASWDGTTFLTYPFTRTGTTTNGSPVVTNVSTTGLRPGLAVVASTIPSGRRILTVDSATQFTMDGTATGTGTGVTLTFGSGAPTEARDLAVFEDRVWIVSADRTITWTAPGSWADWATVNASGSVTVGDTAFEGSITRLLSSQQQLWIFSPSAVNGISSVRVVGTPPVTTFSLTNVVSELGTAQPESVQPYFRSVLFVSGQALYALIGATPQKLSDRMDRFFAAVTATSTWPAAVFTVVQRLVYGVLVRLLEGGAVQPLIACYAQGRWFCLAQGALTWITSLPNPTTGTLELWGTDGTTVRQLMIAETGVTRLRTRLWDFGAITQVKRLLRVAIELDAERATTLTVILQGPTGRSRSLGPVTWSAILRWVNPDGSELVFGSLIWVTGGTLIRRLSTEFSDTAVGLELTGTHAPVSVGALAFEVEPMGEWVGI